VIGLCGQIDDSDDENSAFSNLADFAARESPGTHEDRIDRATREANRGCLWRMSAGWNAPH